MKQTPKILVVDDEKIVRESLFHWFEDEGYSVDTAEDAVDALKQFDKGKYDLILLDMKMPGMSGLELLSKIKEIDKDSSVILITAFASVPTAIQALKEGAYDYVTKPVDPDELNNLVKNAIEQKALKDENYMLKNKIEQLVIPENLIGESEEMRKIFELIKQRFPENGIEFDHQSILKGATFSIWSSPVEYIMQKDISNEEKLEVLTFMEEDVNEILHKIRKEKLKLQRNKT